MVAPPKQRQHFPLDKIPADLSKPISRTLPGTAAIESEVLRRFQVALEYFDIPEPRDQLHRTRLLRAFYLVFPAAFWAPDQRGPSSVSDAHSLALFRWVEKKRGQSKPPKTAAAVIKGALLGTKNREELLDCFPWLKKNGDVLAAGSILNLVTKGQALAEEEASWKTDYATRPNAFPQPAKKRLT
jgi:hypothetical protein